MFLPLRVPELLKDLPEEINMHLLFYLLLFYYLSAHRTTLQHLGIGLSL